MNCAPLLVDLFLHTFEANFLQWLLKSKDRKLAQTFNSSFHYMDDVLSLKNSRFGNYLHLIYPNELEVKVTNDIQKSASYLDLHLEIDNGGRMKTKLYDKNDDSTLPIVNILFISSNIPALPAYRINISKLVRYSGACAHYSDFLDKAQLLMQSSSNKAMLFLC